jgi:hypothetical protein
MGSDLVLRPVAAGIMVESVRRPGSQGSQLYDGLVVTRAEREARDHVEKCA